MIPGSGKRRSLDDAAKLRAEVKQREMVEETLRQAQKLEAMGRLTGGVAHDFNNLLMILNNSLFILLRLNPQLQGRNHAGAMERAVASGAKLTRQLLSFSRRQPFRPELIKLQDTIPAILDLIRPAVGSSVAVSGDVALDTMPVEVDMAELELALVNLAINAKDAMPGGGKLVISAHNVAPGREPVGLGGPLVQLTVADQGKGISEEHLARVFEPFFTTKPPGHGTGLGLSQVYGFCQRAGGTAVVESRLGEGTSVTCRTTTTDGRRPDFRRHFLKNRDHPVQGAAGALPARVYTPDGAGPFPVIVYLHGGGWVIANKEVYDGGARCLAKQANAVVISVDYRQAPENKFPAVWDDALAAYKWTLVNAASEGLPPVTLISARIDPCAATAPRWKTR